MSSTPRHTAPETAERIREAAIAEFAEHGFAKTTVRGIANAAGVSAGLVIHHFGSKDALRGACDSYVFEALTETKRENATGGPLNVAGVLFQGDMRTKAEYLVRSLLEPSEVGQRFFEHYVDVVEEIIEDGFAGYRFRQGDDRRAQATAIAMMALAPMLLESRARGVLGTADVGDTMTRLAPTLFDLYLNGIVEAVPDGHPNAGPRATPGSQHDPPAADNA